MSRNSSHAANITNCKYLVHDRDYFYTHKFESILKDSGITPIKTPPQSPNLNAFAERVIRFIEEECLGEQIILGEHNLKRMLKEYQDYYNSERPHQGIGNEIIQQNEVLIHSKKGEGEILKKERLGGLLNYYYRKAC